MRFLPAGDDALLVELGSLEQTLALFHAIEHNPFPGIQDLVPAARTVLVQYRPAEISSRQLAVYIQGLAGQGDRPADAAFVHRSDRRVEIPVRYQGEDLEVVAQRLGISRAEVIERHTGAEFRAAFAGFAPGFIYLAGGDPCFHGMPRHTTPRTRVPAGSVAMAGDFSAVYPLDSPGGWQLLGVTPCHMWNLDRAEPALVQPGFRVRFRDQDKACATISLPTRGQAESGSTINPSPDAAAKTSPQPAPQPSEPWFDVRATGLRTLVQDLGRFGQTRMGVSRSGALDHGALRDANRIVGNPDGAPALENLLGGLQLRCRGRAVVAVTGADAPVHIATPAGRRVPAKSYQPLALDDGDTLHIGPPRAGTCCYVAVRGAWDVPAVLGSCATDTLAGIGPAPLAIGDALAVGRPSRTAVAPDLDRPFDLPRSGDVVSLDIVLGPRSDWFTDQAVKQLAAQEWTVTPQSDRVGMRLTGERPLARSTEGELPSEGAVAGAIQVPASGQPVLFLADHPLTGGYPVIGAVISRDLDRAAQMPVGVRVRFRPIGPFKEIQP